MAENFAPGTSAADIESAMTPIGGSMLKCGIVTSGSTITAELVFESREGADKVINTFHNQIVSVTTPFSMYFVTDRNQLIG